MERKRKKEEEGGKGSFLSTHDPPVDDVTSHAERAMKEASSIDGWRPNGPSLALERGLGGETTSKWPFIMP